MALTAGSSAMPYPSRMIRMWRLSGSIMRLVVGVKVGCLEAESGDAVVFDLLRGAPGAGVEHVHGATRGAGDLVYAVAVGVRGGFVEVAPVGFAVVAALPGVQPVERRRQGLQ